MPLRSPNLREVVLAIRALIFDLDGTLRVSRPTWEEIFIREAQALGVPVSPEKRRQMNRWIHYFWASSDQLRRWLRQYGESAEFWVAFNAERLRRLGCDSACSHRLAGPLYDRLSHHEETVRDVVPEDTIPTLKALQAQGYRMGLLTNRREPLNGYLEDIGIAPYLEFALVAGDIGVWKPAPEAFLKAVEAAGVQPHEAAYIGDNYYADILGAQRAGLLPVLVDPLDLFPEAENPVIHRLSELPAVLEKVNA